MPHCSLTGVVPIIPTPFRADEQIDHGGLARCVQFAIDSGLQAACLPAYASEFYKLDDRERAAVVETALKAADGRLAIVAQANHPSAQHAATAARRYEQLGASYVSFALPRMFSLPEDDLLRYSRTICTAVSCDVLVQDFNPGGPTVGPHFAKRLHAECPNFKYLKLEEPLMSDKIRAIIAATLRQVGVLEGWGGMYLLELMPAGICGLMPGLGVADLLQRVWQLARDGEAAAAESLFQVILPQVVFALQSSELFNWIEKRLLLARGVLSPEQIFVRSATVTPSAETLAHGDRLAAAIVVAAAVARSA